MSDYSFLEQLLQSPGTSSYEAKPARLWREKAREYGAQVTRDAYGNSFAAFGDSTDLTVMIAGHIDEIGLIITHVDDKGYLYFSGIGIGDGRNLMGQRVRVVNEDGEEYIGVIGRKAPHLSAGNEQSKRVKLDELWIDIGAQGKEDALKRVQPGAFAVHEAPPVRMGEHRLVSKALDNRVGAFIALEAAREAAKAGATARVVATATTQEEIGGIGANVATYHVNPDLAIALDVGHATDVPDVSPKLAGEVHLGKGPAIEFGSTVHQGVAKRLRDTAREADLPFQTSFSPRRTFTDADHMAAIRTGAPTVLLSIPNRYMHSPIEMVDLRDVDSAIQLLARFIARIRERDELLPQD